MLIHLFQVPAAAAARSLLASDCPAPSLVIALPTILSAKHPPALPRISLLSLSFEYELTFDQFHQLHPPALPRVVLLAMGSLSPWLSHSQMLLR